MLKDNIFYYQKEISYLYEARKWFVEKFPKLVPFLSQDSKDPDVERIIENLAILTSRIRQELDQNIPQIAESLINIITPNYTNPIPSLCLQEFFLEENAKENKVIIPKGTEIKSIPINQCECVFKTIYDVYLYPLEFKEVALNNEKHYHSLTLKMQITKEGISIKDLGLDYLKIYLGDDIYVSTTLLFYIHSYLQEVKVVCYDTKEEYRLNPNNIEKMGLSEKEISLSYSDLGFESFCLLTEYFLIPEKFNFISMGGLDILNHSNSRDFCICFKFKKPLPKNCIIRSDIFSLGVSPTINLFSKSAEPIINKNVKDGHRIFIDRTNLESYEIIEVTQVKAHNSDSGRRILKNYRTFERFGLLRESQKDFDSIMHKSDSKGEIYNEISFFSENEQGNLVETITIETLCCNKNLPLQLKIGDINALENFNGVTTKNIKIPTAMKQNKVDGELLWKLVSILSLNYQTLLDKTAFLNALESYGFINEQENKEAYRVLMDCIVKIQSRPSYLIDEHITKKGVICIVHLQDSSFYCLGEVYRFGLIISRFLSSFVSINSFCELMIKCLDSNETLYYPAIFGKKALL